MRSSLVSVRKRVKMVRVRVKGILIISLVVKIEGKG